MAANFEILATRAALLAEIGFWRGLSLKFRSSSGRWDSTDAVVWLIAAAAAGTIAWLVMRNRRLARIRDLYDPRGLFDELCRVHQLPREAVATLHALAQDRGLDSPGILFVHPEYFVPASHRRDDEEFVAAVTQLQRRLFADAESESEPARERVDSAHD